MSEQINIIDLDETHQNPTKKNRFTKVLPRSFTFGNAKVSLDSISLFNQFFNIKQEFNNNTITLTWNASTTTTHTIVIPNGYYGIDLINLYVQNYCIANGLYLYHSETNKNVFFYKIFANEPTYRIQIDTYLLPNQILADELGYTKPELATWLYPTNSQTPQISINTVEFGKLVGFVPQIIPATIMNTAFSLLGNFAPRIEPISGIKVACNLISSPYQNPSSVMRVIKINSSYGSTIAYEAQKDQFLNIQDGTYNKIEITLYDNLMNDLTIQDSDISIVFSIKETL